MSQSLHGQHREHQIRVLIVDDDYDGRLMLRTFLGLEEGITVVGEARDGMEAIDKARQLSPDVILIDSVEPEKDKPGLDGLTAIQRIRSINKTVRIIYHSAHWKNEYIDAAIRAGADLYFAKPSDPYKLTEAVRTIRRTNIES